MPDPFISVRRVLSGVLFTGLMALAPVALAADVDLGITNVVSSSTPLLGSNVTYTIVMSNTNNNDATVAKFTAPVPAGFTFVSGTKVSVGGHDSSGISCSVTSDVLTCNLVTDTTLTKNKSIKVDVVMTITNATGCSQTVPFVVTTGTADTDTNSANNSATATVTTTCPTLTVTKTTVGGNGTFAMSVGGSGFTLITTGNTASKVLKLAPGTYSVTETVPAGWDLTTNGCLNKVLTTGNVNCTITNTKKGHLIVSKTTAPANDPTQFTVTASGNGTITGNAQQTLTASAAVDYEVTPGTYSVAETVPSGWDKTGDTCQNKAVAAGQTVTCTITNTKKGHLIVRKVTDPANDTTAFSITASGNGTITGTAVRPLATTADVDYEVTPGTYSVTEAAKAGWDVMTGNTCVDVAVAAGETKTCTITNSKRGTITIKKIVVPSTDSTTFGFTGDITATLGHNQTSGKEVDTLQNTFYVTENDPGSDWRLSSVVCDDSDSSGSTLTGTATFKVAAGENVTCTFTNVKKTRITVVKETYGGDDEFVIHSDNGLSPSSVTLDTRGDGDHSVSSFFDIFTELSQTYTLTEDAKTGWQARSSTCTVTVAPGGTATCTFKNYRQSRINIVKDTVGGDGTFRVSGNNGLGSTDIITTDGAGDSFFDVFTELSTSYTLTEQLTEQQVADGWVASGPCTVTVGPGETKECGFHNVKKAKIIIDKSVLGGDGEFTFKLTKQGTGEGGADEEETKKITTSAGAGNSFFDVFTELGVQVTVEEITGDPDFDLLRLSCGIQEPSASPSEFFLAAGQTVNCTAVNGKIPTITLIKEVTNDNGGLKTPGNFQLTLDGANAAQGVAIPTTVGPHTVSEIIDSGYYVGTWGGECSGDGAITLEYGDEAECTLTNDDKPGTLKVIKHVNPGYGGSLTAEDFTMTVTGANPDPVSFSGDEAGTEVTLDAGAYSVSEQAPEGSESAYSSIMDGCSGSIANGEYKVCTITNDPVQPKLIVIKHVVNDNGGTADATDVTINVTGINAAPTSFLGNETGTPVLMDVGSYSVIESDLAGYESAYSEDCDGDIGLGETKTCTITNDDIQPLLTVTKIVINDDGGTKEVSDFPLFVDDTSVTSDVESGIDAGTYTVSETGDTTYASVIEGDCDDNGSITLVPGDVKSCTITNDDIPATLIVVKHVENNGVGTKAAADFTLSLAATTGPDTFPGFSGKEDGSTFTVDADTYTVDETPVDGYVKSYSGDCDENGSVTLALSETKTCIVTNTAKKGTIRIVKNTVGGDGTFHFTIDGTIGVDIETTAARGEALKDVFILQNSVTVVEDAQAGWTADQATCTVTPVENQTVDCVFTNTRSSLQRPKLIVKKIVINDNGGTRRPDQFTLTVAGTNVSLPVFQGSTAGTEVSLDSGEYAVAEVPPRGYTVTYSPECSGTINDGETKTCTVTNDDQKATLVVVKKVINNDGGTKTPANFSIKVTAPGGPYVFNGSSAGTVLTFNAGSYSVTETAVAGYEGKFTGSCSGTLAPGQIKVCRIKNDDVKPPKTPRR